MDTVYKQQTTGQTGGRAMSLIERMSGASLVGEAIGVELYQTRGGAFFFVEYQDEGLLRLTDTDRETAKEWSREIISPEDFSAIFEGGS